MIPAKVAAVLQNYGLTATEFEDESASATARSAALAFGVAVGQIAKSLLVRDKAGGYAMVVMAGDKRLSNGKLRDLIGSKCSMTAAEETLAVTGFPIGGVCPFGVDVPVYVDDSLKPYGIVIPAAGTRNSGVRTPYEVLLEIADGKTCEVAETP